MTELELNLPDEKSVKEAFWVFCKTIARLRHPEKGCPWDLKQTHESLRKYMIEEAYEAVAVMTDDSPEALSDELGDVLLQVLLNAQLAADRQDFSIIDVCQQIDHKMKHRHPHVFEEGVSVADAAEVKRNWQEIKAKEEQKNTGLKQKDISLTFEKAYGKGPSTYQALKIGQIAEKIDFDWPDSHQVLAQLREEIDELEAEMNCQNVDEARVADELGDIYFSLTQLARHLKADPEKVALQANQKFLRRFRRVEDLAQKKGARIDQMGSSQLNELWVQAKRDLSDN